MESLGKWIKVDDLTTNEKKLISFEPSETVFIKKKAFRVQSVCLRPAQIVLEPIPSSQR